MQGEKQMRCFYLLMLAGLASAVLIGCVPPSAGSAPFAADPAALAANQQAPAGSAASSSSGAGAAQSGDPGPVDSADSPLGACCLSNVCQVVTEAQCLQAGGHFQGAGTDCSACQLADEQLIAILSQRDCDNDGLTDLQELFLGTDPCDSANGPDIDGDGIPNEDDPDVDGDGVLNVSDPDIDGDSIPNGLDPDPDGDLKTGPDDPDEDGDGLSDRWDLDDDGDGVWDDDEVASGEEEDDQEEDAGEDETTDRLLDLVERLRTGEITEQDRNEIANEIVKRLDGTDRKLSVQAALFEIAKQARLPERPFAPKGVPPAIEAIDAVYDQLAEAVQLARSQQKNPKEPLDPQRMPDVMDDFVARTGAIKHLGGAFTRVNFTDISKNVSQLRTGLDPVKTEQVAVEIGQALQGFDGLGDGSKERTWLGHMSRGASALGKAFPDAVATDLVNKADLLFQLADEQGGTDDDKSKKFQGLLDRMAEISDEEPDIQKAFDQVKDEEQNGAPTGGSGA
jgi:hypothetical protein